MLDNPNQHTAWCDRPEHLASGERGCRRIVSEAEGVAAMLLANGDAIDVAIVGAGGKALWWWPQPILARVAEALAEAVRVRNLLGQSA